MLILEMKKPKTRDVGVYIPITRGKYKDMLLWVDKEDADEFKMYQWGVYIYDCEYSFPIIKGRRNDVIKDITASSLLRMKYASAIPGIQSLHMREKFYGYNMMTPVIVKNIINYRKRNLYPSSPSITQGNMKSIICQHEKKYPETWFNLKTWLQSQIDLS